MALLLVGFGHVARRFVRLLEESRAELDALDVQPVVVGVVTRRGGRCDDAGLDMPRTLEAAEGGAIGPATVPSSLEWFGRLREQRFEARVLVETTTLDVRSGEPAISHVRAGIASGAHVITANKGPVAFAWDSLARAADAAGVSFLFEGAVMDGIPIFNLVRESMPAVRVEGFRGVLNSTTNYMLSAMEAGEAFDAALARMQSAGVAEADPSLDVDGWDAAAKGAALANVLLEARTTPVCVAREGLTAGAGARARDALAAGRRLKLVVSATGRGAACRVQVALEELDAGDPLAILEGQANALELHTWPLGRIVITQRDGGLEKTAYALLADLIAVARRVRAAQRHER
jgi:homoserine dehydrogenase